MSIDVIRFLKKQAVAWDHIPAGEQAIHDCIEKLSKEMDLDYLGVLYRTDYSVTGRGAFPVDMLRYTNSWPRDEADVHEIERSIELADAADPFTVRLTKYHRDQKPNLAEDRWASKFRWKVVESSVNTTEG